MPPPTIYQGAQFLGAKKKQALSSLADVIGKAKGRFGEAMGKRGIWDKVGDIAQVVGNKIIPGVGNIADLLIDQASARMIGVPTGEAIGKQQSGWALAESEAAAEEMSRMASEVDPNKTLLSDILQEGVEYVGSEAGGEMMEKFGDKAKLAMLPDAPFDPVSPTTFDPYEQFGSVGDSRSTRLPFVRRRGGKVPMYQKGRKTTRPGDIMGYTDAHPLYTKSGIGKGTITEGEGWSLDEDAVDMDFVKELKAMLDETGGKLVDFQDPDFDPESEKTRSLQDLAQFLSTQVKSESISEILEQTKGDKSEIIKDLYRSSTQTQSPYSDLGFFMESSEDQGGFQQAAGDLLQGIPLMEPTKVSPKKEGLQGLAQRLLPGGETGYMAGGGIVQDRTPTIADYFAGQGKTLGGSNTEPISEILRKG